MSERATGSELAKLKVWQDLLACPRDGSSLAENSSEGLSCVVCGFACFLKDGILVYSRQEEPLSLEKISEMAVRDQDASKYETKFGRLRNDIEIPPYLKMLRPASDDQVLELGCGTGRVTRRYIDQVARAVLVDFSYESLLILKQALNSEQAEKCLLIQGDICSPPLKKGTFSKIVSFQVIEHLPTPEDRRGVFNKIAELLLPSGALVASVYNWSLEKQRLSKIGDPNNQKQGFHSHQGSAIFYYNFDGNELKALLAGAGLQVKALQGLQLQVRGVGRLGRWALPLNRILQGHAIALNRSHLLLVHAVHASKSAARDL